MITFAILILIVAKALPGLNTHISSIHITRITSIVFLFAGALSFNILNLESLGSGIGIYSGFFQATPITQLIEIFLFLIGGGILIALDRVATAASRCVTQFQHNLTFSPLASNLLQGITSFNPISQAYPNQGSNSIVRSLGIESQPSVGTDYSLIVLFSSLGSSLLISSYDLISIYLSIELQSFGLYVLSILHRDSESSTSAGLKYFLLGGLSSCIILLGTGIIYSYTGTTNLESLYIINSVADITRLYIIQGISLGLSLIFIGFLFKIAAAPLHNWSPDVYDGTPTIVTIWLTIIPKIAILFILLELQVKLGSFGPLGDGLKTIIVNNSGYLLNFNLGHLGGAINDFISLIFSTSDPLAVTEGVVTIRDATVSTNGVAPSQLSPSVAATATRPIGVSHLGSIPLGYSEGVSSFGSTNGNIIKSLLLISATLSLIIGSLLGLAQKKIKRLLAYSTISHLGFILLALAVNTEQSIDSFIFYILQYTLTNLNIFLVILALTYSISYYSEGHALATASEGNGENLTKRLKRTPSDPIEQPYLESPMASVGVITKKDISYISEFKGLFFNYPLLSISLAVSLFSMAGIPPLIGFFSKQLVLLAAVQNGFYFISILAIIVSVISCSYYLQIIKLVFTPSNSKGKFPHTEGRTITLSGLKGASKMVPANVSINWTPSVQAIAAANRSSVRNHAIGSLRLSEGTTKSENSLSNTHSYLISILTFTILLFFIKPSLILNSTQLLSLSLFYI